MSSDVANVYIGAQPNDGSGDPIRSAFNQVNNNFGNIDTRISHGNIAQIYATVTVTGQNLVSNTSTTTQTLVVTNGSMLSGTTNVTNLAVSGTITGSTISTTGNVDVANTLSSKDIIINGNLTVYGTTTTVSSVNTTINDSLMHLHTANGGPWTYDDGNDIGFTFDYYKGEPKKAALVWATDTQALEFYANGTEIAGNTFTGTYGNIKAGSFFAANSTATAFSTPGGVTAGTASVGAISANTATANVVTTANLTVTNKIVGSLYIGGPGSTDTIYVNGVPVATAVSAFNGGQVGNKAWFLDQLVANSQIISTSTTTGAIIVDGGVGITGNIYAGAIHDTPISGSSGDFTTLSVSSTFAASSVSFLGGYITNVHGDATQWAVTDFTSGNVKITGGTVTGLTSLGASGVAFTSGTITGLTNLTTTSATITSGSLTGLSQVTSTNLTSTNGLVVSGTGARIAGDFSNATVTNRLIFQTTTTNGATNISVMPRGTIASTVLASGFNVEDTASVATGSGSIGSLEMYQSTEVRLSSAARGTGTYLPLTVYTNGSRNAQFATTHDVTIYNTGGAGVISLGANGVITATSFTGSVAGASVTGTVANATAAAKLQTARLINGISFDGTADITIPGTTNIAAANLTGSILSSNVTASTLTSVGTLTSLTTSGDVIVGGNFTVNGTTTTVNATTLDIADLNITVAKNAASAAAANGAGLTVGGAGATILYTSATDTWDFNKTIVGSVAGAQYTESGTAPSSPTAGDQWYNTTSDILYQFIGTSWVDVFTAGVTATSTATANAIAQRDGSGGAAFSTMTAANVFVSGAITTSGVGTVNIGTNTNKFGTIYGTATTAQYADLAERYASDKQYEPGTVVVFGGPQEITVNDGAYDTRIAGVVSTNPAYLMNDSNDGLPIALTGRVPCKVIGPIRKGDVLVASKFPGIAQTIDNSLWKPGCVIGKALAAVEQTEITTIEVVIGRF
jgi:hypothetical protein